MASKQLTRTVKRSALAVALGLCFAGGVHVQSTTGGIHGTVPGGEGASVVVSNASGFSRTVAVGGTSSSMKTSIARFRDAEEALGNGLRKLIG